MKKALRSVLPVLMFVAILTPAAPAYEPHPQIRAALEALRNAKRHLEEGAHDFHGHRVAALKHVDQAIAEAQICLREQ
jgi:hypothetical protein